MQRCLKKVIKEMPLQSAHIILEFEIPRRQKRPDVILLLRGIIIVIEFKFGAITYDAASKWQVEEYAFNLRDFHLGSATRTIVPVLCATEAPDGSDPELTCNRVSKVVCCNQDSLPSTILKSARILEIPDDIDATQWLRSPYRPSLTIIEAAERIYAKHDVTEINHSHAANLNQTTDLLAETIERARSSKKRYTYC